MPRYFTDRQIGFNRAMAPDVAVGMEDRNRRIAEQILANARATAPLMGGDIVPPQVQDAYQRSTGLDYPIENVNIDAMNRNLNPDVAINYPEERPRQWGGEGGVAEDLDAIEISRAGHAGALEGERSAMSTLQGESHLGDINSQRLNAARRFGEEAGISMEDVNVGAIAGLQGKMSEPTQLGQTGAYTQRDPLSGKAQQVVGRPSASGGAAAKTPPIVQMAEAIVDMARKGMNKLDPMQSMMLTMISATNPELKNDPMYQQLSQPGENPIPPEMVEYALSIINNYLQRSGLPQPQSAQPPTPQSDLSGGMPEQEAAFKSRWGIGQ